MDLTELLIGIVMLLVLLAYAFHILVFTYGWLKLRSVRRVSVFHPQSFITVVVAMRDEAGNIAGLIGALMQQDYPAGKVEVLLVDDHSGDGSGEITERMIREEGLVNFRVVSLAGQGRGGSKKRAIAEGVSLASGTLVAVTDADCRPSAGWLSALQAEVQVRGLEMVCGPVRPEPEAGFSGMFRELEFLSLSGTGAGAIGAGRPVFCSGASMAFTRKAFLEVGGYSGNEKYASGDDVFLLHKIRERYGSSSIGYVSDPRAMVETKMPPGWKGFLRQRIRWASKAKGYKDLFSLSTALSVFSLNLALFLLIFSGLWEPHHWFFLGYLFLMKMMLDFPILFGAAFFYRRERLLWWFIPFEFIYIFYVVGAGLVSLFYGGMWKGRRV